jgi:hypothetical protein
VNLYHFALGKLDNFIKTFIIKHSMPFRFRRFNKGVTQYLMGLNSKSKKDKGSSNGTLGLIDAQDISSLMFQMLLGKFLA